MRTVTEKDAAEGFPSLQSEKVKPKRGIRFRKVAHLVIGNSARMIWKCPFCGQTANDHDVCAMCGARLRANAYLPKKGADE